MDLNVPSIRLSAVSAAGILDELQEDVLRAQPGSMFVVHLTLPHYPYAYRSDCSMRDPATWLTSSNPAFTDPKNVTEQTRRGRRNDTASRAERYPLYLEQVVCTHEKLGQLFGALDDAARFNEMTVVIHGDHGSRINQIAPSRRYPGIRLSNADMTDSFSTLFAVKMPGARAVYDRRMLPLGPLFESVVRNGTIPEGTEWAGSREVYFRHVAKGKEARPMPVFSRDLKPYAPSPEE